MGKVRFRGGWTCECVAKSLPLVEADMIKKGIIKHNVDIFQLGYNSSVEASAGTHDGGGNTDVGQYSDAGIKVWREWGWCQQHRTPAQGFSNHGHGWPKGCPHMSKGGNYQASEWQAGRNGLRSKGPITGPGPKGKDTPTWTQGIKNHAPKPTPKPPTPSPLPPSSPPGEGILGMTKSIYFRWDEDRKFKSENGWIDLYINDKHFVTVTGENRTVMVTATIRVAGLVDKEWVEIAWRLVEVVKEGDKDVTKVRHSRKPVTVIGITDRKQNETITFNGAVPKNLRLRAAARTNSQNAVIDEYEVQGWKE
jgi:hypothetical protein